jgi:steroid delta-isomerase-like uncharacterized protein
MQEPLAAALVRRFYAEVWNRRSAEVAREILAPDFAFRGSLDAVRTSAEGFIDYMHKVHDALGGYTCTIVDLVASGDRAVACLDFHGVHRGPFFGVPATGREIRWAGAAFFREDGGRLVELWVLGDVDAVKKQLGCGAQATFEG